MTRLNIFLVLILVACALSVVAMQHKARKLSVALEKERVITRQLKIEHGRLQLEQSTLGMHTHIESIASEKLNMIMPTDSHIQVISAAP